VGRTHLDFNNTALWKLRIPAQNKRATQVTTDKSAVERVIIFSVAGDEEDDGAGYLRKKETTV
jgi:hypothetical protein